MSTSTDTHKAWLTVMQDLATQYASVRSKAFYNSMKELAQLPLDNRSVVTPYGVLVAEMIGSIAILKAQIDIQGMQAIKQKDSTAVQFFTRVDAQIELAAQALRNIDLV